MALWSIKSFNSPTVYHENITKIFIPVDQFFGQPPLDCEARGYPAPTITWSFVNTEGKTISLPSKF